MAKTKKARTIGELKASGYKPVAIKEELRLNLLTALKKKGDVFCPKSALAGD